MSLLVRNLYFYYPNVPLGYFEEIFFCLSQHFVENHDNDDDDDDNDDEDDEDHYSYNSVNFQIMTSKFRIEVYLDNMCHMMLMKMMIMKIMIIIVMRKMIIALIH